VNAPLLDTLTVYNAEIRGLYNFYCLATDVSTKLGKFKFCHYYFDKVTFKDQNGF